MLKGMALSTLRLAASGPGIDFEDNLQIASAVETGLDAIVTRDPKAMTGRVDHATPFLKEIDVAASALV